jgi:hypothetical protein
MKVKARQITAMASLALMVLLSTSCSFKSTTIDGKTKTEKSGFIPDLISESREKKEMARLRQADPLPESEWNRLGDWKKVGNDPPTYIPRGYTADSPRTEKNGDWFVDARDGKRLFVPKQSTPGKYSAIISPGVLRGEAAKITNPGGPPPQ